MMTMNLPQDPIMLLSYVNTQLRDNYGTLDDFCASAGVPRRELEEKLRAANYEYDEQTNRFC